MSYTFNQITSSATCNGVKMSVAGCGPCSIASLVYNLRPEKNLHETVFRHMATKGYMPAGSTRVGMSNTMDFYDLKYSLYTTSFTAWKEGIAKTHYGIVLVHGPGGCPPRSTAYYTNRGHYLAISEYKVENGIEYVYIRDSGAKRRTGWQKVNADLKTAFISGWVIEDTWSKAEKQPDPKPTVKCYPKYTGNSTSIVDALKAVGEKDTSLSHRMAIASCNNISAANNTLMNIRLLEALKNGTLMKE